MVRPGVKSLSKQPNKNIELQDFIFKNLNWGI